MNRALAAMVGAMFCFSIANVCVRVVTRSGLSSQQALFISAGGVATILAVLLYRKHGWRGLIGTDRRKLLVRGLTGFGSATCFLYTLAKLHLADAAMIQYLNPVFVAFLAPSINNERVRKSHWMMLGVALAGAALVLKPTFEYAMFAALIGVLGAVFSAVAYSLVRALRTTEPEQTIIFYYVWMSAVFAAPGLGYRWVNLSPALWWAVPGMILGLLVAQLLMTYGLTRETGVRATGVSYTAVLFNAIWGYVLFGETLGAGSYFGVVLVIAGVLGIASVKDKPAIGIE